jgi:hypothetical protein
VWCSRSIEHLDSAHDEQVLETLKAAAPAAAETGQDELDIGLPAGASLGGQLLREETSYPMNAA